MLGRAATDLLKLNLVKKARILQHIGARADCETLYCTYTCWTLKRLGRRNAWPERKQADYLLRYLVLAASSAAVARVYWGPLACHRDGLIDDGARDYPDIDQVSFYRQVRGKLGKLAIRPGFAALQHAVRRLSETRCRPLLHEVDGPQRVRAGAVRRTDLCGGLVPGRSKPADRSGVSRS